jgi:hypothetical protein
MHIQIFKYEETNNYGCLYTFKTENTTIKIKGIDDSKGEGASHLTS